MTETRIGEAVVFDRYETLISEYAPMWKSKLTTATRLGVDEHDFHQERSQIQRDQMGANHDTVH